MHPQNVSIVLTITPIMLIFLGVHQHHNVLYLNDIAIATIFTLTLNTAAFNTLSFSTRACAESSHSAGCNINTLEFYMCDKKINFSTVPKLETLVVVMQSTLMDACCHCQVCLAYANVLQMIIPTVLALGSVVTHKYTYKNMVQSRWCYKNITMVYTLLFHRKY